MSPPLMLEFLLAWIVLLIIFWLPRGIQVKLDKMIEREGWQ